MQNSTIHTDSLYDQYAPGASARPRRVGHQSTKTSRLRSNILKLNCYLNGEADRSRCAVVKLPEECDTLGEVLPKIHKKLDLDKRIAYAAELFLPDGTKIKTYPMLVDAAENDHAIIVTCGEAFDPTTVPYDLLEAYLHGGGRLAMRKVGAHARAAPRVYTQGVLCVCRACGRVSSLRYTPPPSPTAPANQSHTYPTQPKHKPSHPPHSAHTVLGTATNTTPTASL